MAKCYEFHTFLKIVVNKTDTIKIKAVLLFSLYIFAFILYNILNIILSKLVSSFNRLL